MLLIHPCRFYLQPGKLSPMKPYSMLTAALLLTGEVTHASTDNDPVTAALVARTAAGLTVVEAMVEQIRARKGDAPAIMVAAMTAAPEQTLELFSQAVAQAPELVALLLSNAISVSAVEYHAALYRLAIALGMDPEEALLAAITGGADPTALADAPAAGPGIVLAVAPAPPAAGSGGGGTAAVSPN